MEYQKIISLLANIPNQPTKFRTKKWDEINDDGHGTYNANSQIRFKILMLRASICDYSDSYILLEGTIVVTNTGTAAAPNNRNKKLIFRNCALFTDCVSEINNSEIAKKKALQRTLKW